MASGGFRQGTIVYNIRGFVRGTELDRQRNELIEAIEEKLDSDRYRGKTTSIVQNSQVTNVEVIERLAPLAEFVISYEVDYMFVRGSA